MIFKEFSHQGEWWLPESPNNKIFGTLSVNPTRNELELFGSFIDLGSEVYSFQIILGKIGSGELVTLYQNSLAKISENIGKGNTSLRLSTRYVFIGKHFESKECIKFSSVEFSFSGLSEWVSHDILTTKYISDKKEKKLKEFRVSFTPKDDVIHRIDAIKSELIISNTWSNQSNKYDYEFTHNSYLELNPNASHNFDWFNKILLSIKRLFTLLLGSPIYFDKIRFQMDFDDSKDNYFDEIDFYERDYILPKKQDFTNQFISYPQVSKEFNSILDNWFNIVYKNKLDVPLKLYTDTFYEKVIRPNLYFIAVYLSLEGFIRYKNTVTSGKANIKKGLISLINNVHTNKLFKNYFCSTELFTNRIEATRNYLIHFNNKSEKYTIEESGQLFVLSQQLRFVVTTFILIELGLPVNLISDVVEGFIDYSYLKKYRSR